MVNNEAHNRDLISAAIVGAADQQQYVESQIMQLQAQLQRLQQHATQLQSFISLGKALLGEETSLETPVLPGETEASTTAYSSPGIFPRKLTISDHARQTLEEVQRPMRVTEMADYLVQRGLVKGQWPKEVLRTAMRKNPQIFERVAEGVYALKAWPPEQKCILGDSLSFPPSKETQQRMSAKRNVNTQQPLPACIVELLEAAGKRMRPAEIEEELTRIGKRRSKEVVTSTLSTLVSQGRIKRPAPAQYVALSIE
jgi:hypothetical protein